MLNADIQLSGSDVNLERTHITGTSPRRANSDLKSHMKHGKARLDELNQFHTPSPYRHNDAYA